MDLSLAKLKIPAEKIRDAIVQMDEEILDAERLSQIIRCAPSKEEIQLVQSFQGDHQLLGSTEKFFLAVSSIPNLVDRLNFWNYKLKFQATFQSFQVQLKLVTNSFSAIQASQKFKRVLEIILAIGNALNAGSRSGGAFGFKLSALSQLKGTKSVDGKSNLLEYIVKHCNENSPNHLTGVDSWTEDFRIVSEAAKLESRTLISEIEQFANTMKTIESNLEEFKNENESEKDRFHEVMAEFVVSANSKAIDLLSGCSQIKLSGAELVQIFGEEMHWESLLHLLRDFVQDWRQTKESLSGAQKKAQTSSLLDEIKRGIVLKKVEQKDQIRANVSAAADGIGALTDQLRARITERRFVTKIDFDEQDDDRDW